MNVHLVPGGTYCVGQANSLDRELPEESCTVSAFLVGRLPVLQREWDRLPGSDQRAHVGGALPISGVSWIAAQEWLTAARLRLPTEREWECACRAGTTTPYPWGAGMDGRLAWFLDNSGGRLRECTLHVQQPNAYGLVDICGNVAEWCSEDLDLPGEGSSWQEGNPGKVHRGGSFESPSNQLRASYRCGSDPAKPYPDLGLRAFADVFAD